MHVVSYMVSSSGVRNVKELNATKRQTNLTQAKVENGDKVSIYFTEYFCFPDRILKLPSFID